MFRNYLLTTLRDIRRNALYASIKIFGLAIGMACAILIMLFIRDELSYDRYHTNANRIFRLTVKIQLPGREMHHIITRGETGPQLAADYPEIADIVRIDMHRWFVVEHGETRVTTDPLYADPSILNVFSFPLLRGDRKTALSEPTSVVITQGLAKRLFANADPMGQTIAIYDLNKKYDLKITGILKDIPANSHFRFEFLASLDHLRSRSPENADNRLTCVTYLLLKDKRDGLELQKKLPDFVRRHMGPSTPGRTYYLQPLTSIHLGSHLELELEENSSLSVSYTLSLIAFFVLFVAGINFVNLSIARASRRGREVGMRKVVGASKSQLVRQFMSEAIVLALISLGLAVLIALLLLPSFNLLVGKHLGLGVGASLSFYAALLLLALVVGLLSGSYPAFFLSAYKPAIVLKGETPKGGSSGTLVRKGLVVTQFAVALVFIIGTLVVSRQLNYVKNKDLGVKNENVIDLPIFKDEALTKRVDLVERELGSVPGVVDITVSTGEVGFYSGWPIQCIPEGHAPDSPVMMNVLLSGNGFFKFFGVNIVQGRDFQKEIASDAASSIIINETAAKTLGWQTPVGKRISSTYFSDERDKLGVRTVIGVVHDFHNGSLHEKIMPSIYQFLPEQNNEVFIRLRPDKIPETLGALEKKWKDLPTHIPFVYHFLDNPLESGMYSQDRKFGRIFGFSSTLALFLAAIGVFGLMSFAAERRRREIGIRKVMGANRVQIVALLVKDLSVLVVIANIVAWPVGYYVSSRWLRSFAYRIGIEWWIFIASGLGILAIALLTISFQSIKAASSNPVKTLRYE
jgi:putative ABC transport system permease protein